MLTNKYNGIMNESTSNFLYIMKLMRDDSVTEKIYTEYSKADPGGIKFVGFVIRDFLKMMLPKC